MSNPFATFRKNQKYWMAGLVLVSLFAFVIYPVFDYARRAVMSGGSEKQVVVRWRGGKITVVDAQNWSRKHGALVRFLVAVAREVIDRGGQPKVPGFFVNPDTKQIDSLGISMSSDIQDICRTRIFAEYGKRMGIALDDDAIDDFLRNFCDGRIDSARIDQILMETTDGTLDWFEIREMLKTELTAVLVNQLLLSPLAADPPGVAYEDFLKLNRTAKVEAFPVLVDDFIDDVQGRPTEAELKAIYEDGKSRVPNPNSPRPGFALPYQANLEYVEGDLTPLIEREKKKLTEEQLRAEYERRVELGQLQVPVETPQQEGATDEGAEQQPEPQTTMPNKEASPSPESAAPSGSTPPATTPPASTPPSTAPPATGESAEPHPEPPAPEPLPPAPTPEPPAPAPEPTAPEEEPPAPEPESPAPQPQSPAPAPEPPAPEPNAAEPRQEGDSEAAPTTGTSTSPAGETAPASDPDTEQPAPSSASTRNLSGHLVSVTTQQSTGNPESEPAATNNDTQNDAPATDAKEEAPPEPPVNASAKSQPAGPRHANQDTPSPEKSSTNESEPDGPKPAEEMPQEETTEVDSTKSAEPPTTSAEEQPAEQPSQTEEEPAPKMRTLSFEEARDTIADELARTAASKALEEALKALHDEVMLPYYQSYRQYRALKESSQQLGTEVPDEPPQRPDLSAAAAKYGLTVKETGLVDVNQLSATQLGRSEASLPDLGIQRQSVAQLATSPVLELFYPVRSLFIDFTGLSRGEPLTVKQYLFWKIEERPSRIPSYDEVIDAVVDAWKRRKARLLAAAHANEIAKKVKSGSDDPWSEALPEESRSLLVTTSPFTWMSRFGEFIAPSDVPELENVGDEFMQAVFAAQPGETVVAPNASHDIFYVARVVEFAPPEEELLARFQADTVKAGPRQIAADRRNRAVMDLYTSIMEEMEVQWELDPTQFE